MKTKLVGILNITPDSFSDGGKFDSLDSALIHTKKLIDDGADVIDIGAESTRPSATPISTAQEWSRLEKLLPEILKITKNANRKIETSIDSYHFENIKKSYELGVDIINDISGLKDERTIDFIAANNIKTILMHNEKIPPLENTIVNEHLNLTRAILKWAAEKIAHLRKKQVNLDKIIFDPGIGFNKDANQSIRILKYIKYYQSLNLPIYIGHSKKSFLAAIDFNNYGKNLSKEEKTLIISEFLIKQKVDYLRVHDVKEHKNLIN